MNSQYFGFEDEEIVDTVETIVRPTIPAAAIARTPMKVPANSSKISISEIQALLGKDPAVEESTLDSTLNESSFYADEDTSINQSQLDATMDESFTADDSTLGNITVVNGKPRKIIKAERKTRKALASIGDNNEDDDCDELAEQLLKKRFQEIENYQLVVE
ncbi:uncharacterized protein LOC135834336 isoform X2 [Planococcus citri]|uniref:uncharacterized protein LOC135834336 isoform X2 n=1 Tax=Planococcus citri TaxID=170843 RepID=UPI0031F970EA